MNHSTLQMMDVTSLKAVLSDLRKKIIPSRFEKIQQSDSHTVQIAFRNLNSLIWLELSWHADSPRLIEIKAPPKIHGESTLSKQIKYATKGMALIELKQQGFDRVIEFGLAFRPNESFQKFLILELMGRHSNFLLLDEKRNVTTLGKQIRESQSRLRPISTGDKYIPPPSLRGLSPTKTGSFEEWKKILSLVPVSLKKALNDNFQGISPSLSLQLANENKDIANTLINTSVQNLSSKDWQCIYSRWEKWLRVIDKEEFCLCFNGPSPYRVWKPERLAKDSDCNLSLNLGGYYTKFLAQKKLEEAYKKLSSELIKRKINEERLLHKQQDIYQKTLNVNSLTRSADMILCLNDLNKEKIKEAQKLYNTAKKLKRAKSILLERVKHHEERILFINETNLFLEYIINNKNQLEHEKLTSIKNLIEDIETYLFNKQQTNTKKGAQRKQPHQILQIKSPSGLDIQIGRNHRQNELISIKKSKKGDIWFHAQECPGSHIVLKASNGTIEEEDIKVSADLASFLSKAKGNNKVSVLMVQTNQLQKLKGAATGTVSPREGKVVWGQPSNGKRYLEQSTKKA
ncbi:Rqc2 family fibronectin-binding protein [Prochlorococcus marinus]|uniref:Rqc2 family fibronectin-binding protein n=1 Tax=Prochlorococcus marinus TaxID=1219 RepID=UPI0022B4236C|nr:NFACT RNA binding domain-containing protein [Prochlorococcus marinus]